MLSQVLLKWTTFLQTKCAYGNDQSIPTKRIHKLYSPLHNEDIQITAALCFVSMYHIIFAHLTILHIRRIPNNHIKSTPLHNPVELHPPVKRLVALLPLREALIV